MASENTVFPRSVWVWVLLGPLRLAVGLLLGVCGLLVTAWTVDWIYVFWVWPDGIAHLRQLLAEELAQGVEMAVRQGRRPEEATVLANHLYAMVFKFTGVHEMGLQFANDSSLAIPDTILRRAYIAKREWIETAMVGTQLLGIRLGAVFRGAALVLLLYMIGMVEGLAARSVRRSGGGGESASLYHRAKLGLVGMICLGGVGTLLWPGVVPWGTCLGTGVLGTIHFARLQGAYFKKHL